MSNTNYLGLRRDLDRVEESLTERLARINEDAKTHTSADEATVAAVECMLVSKRQEVEDDDEDIEDDFAGGTSGVDGSPWLMPWRSHLAEFILRLKEKGYEKYVMDLASLADRNSLKKPFTAIDEANVIKSIQEYLEAFKKEVSGNETPTPDGETTSKYDGLDTVRPAHQNAYLSYKYAEGKIAELYNDDDRVKDSKAYNWLKGNGIDDIKKLEAENMGKLEGYKLPPNFNTWRRYVSKARKALGEQKYAKRNGRDTGKSIVRPDEIEYQLGEDG